MLGSSEVNCSNQAISQACAVCSPCLARTTPRRVRIPLVSPFTISGPSAFDLRDFGDAIHCVGHSCLEAVSAMERRLLVGGDPCADHRQGQGVTVQIEVLERTPALRHSLFRLCTGYCMRKAKKEGGIIPPEVKNAVRNFLKSQSWKDIQAIRNFRKFLTAF